MSVMEFDEPRNRKFLEFTLGKILDLTGARWVSIFKLANGETGMHWENLQTHSPLDEFKKQARVAKRILRELEGVTIATLCRGMPDRDDEFFTDGFMEPVKEESDD